MGKSYTLESRIPSVEEYLSLVESVLWKSREPVAVAIALAQSLTSVCAMSEGQIIGMGRVIGDNGLHYYISDLMVRPEWQRQGVGSALMSELMNWLNEIPYSNSVVGILPTKGLTSFYQNFGFQAQKAHSPAMSLWLNDNTLQ